MFTISSREMNAERLHAHATPPPYAKNRYVSVSLSVNCVLRSFHISPFIQSIYLVCVFFYLIYLLYVCDRVFFLLSFILRCARTHNSCVTLAEKCHRNPPSKSTPATRRPCITAPVGRIVERRRARTINACWVSAVCLLLVHYRVSVSCVYLPFKLQAHVIGRSHAFARLCPGRNIQPWEIPAMR